MISREEKYGHPDEVKPFIELAAAVIGLAVKDLKSNLKAYHRHYQRFISDDPITIEDFQKIAGRLNKTHAKITDLKKFFTGEDFDYYSFDLNGTVCYEKIVDMHVTSLKDDTIDYKKFGKFESQCSLDLDTDCKKDECEANMAGHEYAAYCTGKCCHCNMMPTCDKKCYTCHCFLARERQKTATPIR